MHHVSQRRPSKQTSARARNRDDGAAARDEKHRGQTSVLSVRCASRRTMRNTAEVLSEQLRYVHTYAQRHPCRRIESYSITCMPTIIHGVDGVWTKSNEYRDKYNNNCTLPLTHAAHTPLSFSWSLRLTPVTIFVWGEEEKPHMYRSSLLPKGYPHVLLPALWFQLFGCSPRCTHVLADPTSLQRKVVETARPRITGARY